MMTKHFAAAFVALSMILSFCPVDAFARGHPTFSRAAGADDWVEEIGTASYYGPAFNGHLAADGSRFNQEALTAAHPWLPFGTKVKVTRANTGQTVVVTITDRIYSNRRVVDLSVAAARQLGFINRGLAKVTLAPV